MTIDNLVSVIALVCHINSPGYSRVYREECSTYMVNCAVGEAGKIEPKTVRECIAKTQERFKNW